MWKRTFGLIATAVSLLSAETALYTDANRSLYDSPRNRSMGGALMPLSSEPMPSGLAAGLTAEEKSSVNLGYSSFFANSFGATTIGFVHPVDSKQAIGGSISYLMIPGIDSTSIVKSMDGVPGDYSNHEQTASELYVNLAYGRDILKFRRGTLAAGGSLHMKRARLIKLTGYGVGADLSVQSRFNSGVSLALKCENVFTEYSYWTKDYHESGLPKLYFGTGFARDLSRALKLSLAYRSPDLLGNSGVGGGSLTKDGQFDGEPEVLKLSENPGMLFTYAGYGTEFLFHRKVAFRAGWSDTRMLSFGGGVHLFDRWDVDFVYAHSGALEGTYSVATKLEF